jgi:hypothetical protein
MAVHRLSRYSFTSGLDKDGVFQLTDREPFRYQQYPDTILHTVKTSDTLFTLASKFYAGATRPSGLWWVIADFQPDPIIDPTIALSLGRTIFIPSLRTVTEEVFSPDRRTESRGR